MRGQRVIEGARCDGGVRPPRVQTEAIGVERNRDGDGVVLVAVLERRDVADQQVIGDGRRGRDHLRAADHDAVVALAHDPRVQERLGLQVRGLRTIDLRRGHRVGHEPVVGTRLAVELRDAVTEARAATVEHVAPVPECRDDRGDVVRVRPMRPKLPSAQCRCTRRRRSRSAAEVGGSHITLCVPPSRSNVSSGLSAIASYRDAMTRAGPAKPGCVVTSSMALPSRRMVRPSRRIPAR